MLTERQRQVVERLRQGQSNKEIAYGLGIGIGTVKTHIGAILIRLGARNRTEAAVLAQNEKTPAEKESARVLLSKLINEL